ncbi:MAG TPA: tetratricopeptide repeat protein [Pseudolabrys sp.]|nr:tetratricopeptide repeat protein [Pseudolabrys sp.]
MRPRFLVPLAALLAVAFAAPVAAEPESRPVPPKEAFKPATKLSLIERGHNIDFLFGALKAAPDDTSAKAIEQRIWALWSSTRSDTTALLMSRVKTAIEQKDTDLAITLLDAIVKIKPDYVEAWNRRATIYYMKKDYGRALADIRQVLKLEPRHFGALSGLGLILQDIGDDKQALEVYRRALAVYPRLERVPELVKTLQEKIEGRDI